MTRDVFDAAVASAERKKGLDLSSVELLRYADGLSVQCMHLGPYDAEPETLEAMERCAAENGCVPDYAGASTTSSISATPAAASRSGSGRSSAYR